MQSSSALKWVVHIVTTGLSFLLVVCYGKGGATLVLLLFSCLRVKNSIQFIFSNLLLSYVLKTSIISVYSPLDVNTCERKHERVTVDVL
jgi:hypothetical protein